VARNTGINAAVSVFGLEAISQGFTL